MARPSVLALLLAPALALAGCAPYLGLPIPDTPEAHRCADSCKADHATCLHPPTRPELPKPRALSGAQEPILSRDDEQQRTEACDRTYRTCLNACIPAASRRGPS